MGVRALALIAALAALVAAVVALVVARAWRRWRGSRRARARAARAIAGEDRAAELLRRAGFRVVARQVRIAWQPVVDGVPRPTELRVDYIVDAGGQRLVAEVKTGEAAPSIANAATRRQLLEYQVAFEATGVLLVCPESGTVHQVDFPVIFRRSRTDAPSAG